MVFTCQYRFAHIAFQPATAALSHHAQSGKRQGIHTARFARDLPVRGKPSRSSAVTNHEPRGSDGARTLGPTPPEHSQERAEHEHPAFLNDSQMNPDIQYSTENMHRSPYEANHYSPQ